MGLDGEYHEVGLGIVLWGSEKVVSRFLNNVKSQQCGSFLSLSQ